MPAKDPTISDQAFDNYSIKVIIPALNEAKAIAKVIREIPQWVNEIIVVDNGSTDDTAVNAQQAGATLIKEPIAGYGRACLAGINAAGICDIIVFIDGDASDFPEEMGNLVRPLVEQDKDFIVGTRLNGSVAPGALTPQQRFGNSLACWLMAKIWGSPFTDLGPFRAIKTTALQRLNMQAKTFGWTVEMQVRALKHQLNVDEVPVKYRHRIGTSKISGTVKGVILAGFYILGTIAIEALKPVQTSEK